MSDSVDYFSFLYIIDNFMKNWYTYLPSSTEYGVFLMEMLFTENVIFLQLQKKNIL